MRASANHAVGSVMARSTRQSWVSHMFAAPTYGARASHEFIKEGGTPNARRQRRARAADDQKTAGMRVRRVPSSGRRVRAPHTPHSPHSESRPLVIRVSGSLTSNFLARSPRMPNASIRSIFGPR